MADKDAAPAKRKRAQTVRERSQSGAAPAKRRRLRKTAGTAARPFRLVGRTAKRVFKPFAFVLKPFKTRPARFAGRILASVLLLRFIRQSWQELRKVDWPGRKETWKLTGAVFLFATVFGLVIALTDYGLDKIFRKVLL